MSSSAAARDPALWPFAVDSPWNSSLGSGAVYTTINSPRFSPNRGANLNVTNWSHPVFIAKSTDPVQKFFDDDEPRSIASLHVPKAATQDPSDDGSLHIIDGTQVVEMWQARRLANGDWTAPATVLNDLQGPGFFDNWHGIRAGGMSGVGGLIRRHELEKLEIPHALAIAVETKALNRLGPKGNAWVWPASWADGAPVAGLMYSTAGNVFMGSLLAIPPQVDLKSLNLTPQALAVGRALQDYGAYITDTGSGNVIYYVEPAADAIVHPSLATHLARLTPHLRVVTNNTAASLGGGGTPRRPSAPPLKAASER